MRDTLSKDLADWQENAERKRRQSLHANAVRWEREHARRISHSPQDPGDPPGSSGSKKQNKNKKQKQNKETEQETESETEKDIRAEKEEEASGTHQFKGSASSSQD